MLKPNLSNDFWYFNCDSPSSIGGAHIQSCKKLSSFQQIRILALFKLNYLISPNLVPILIFFIAWVTEVHLLLLQKTDYS